jgi:hypothetical protein
MIKNFTFTDGGGWVDWGFFVNEMYKECIYFLPALACLVIIGGLLWLFNQIFYDGVHVRKK